MEQEENYIEEISDIIDGCAEHADHGWLRHAEPVCEERFHHRDLILSDVY